MGITRMPYKNKHGHAITVYEIFKDGELVTVTADQKAAELKVYGAKSHFWLEDKGLTDPKEYPGDPSLKIVVVVPEPVIEPEAEPEEVI